MKKLLYIFLAVSIIFSACKKEEEVVVKPTVINGCTDSTALNYNQLANTYEPADSCEYSIVSSWELDQIWIDNQDETGSFFEFYYTFNDNNTTYYQFARAVNGNVLMDTGSEVYSIFESTITCIDVVDSESAIWNVDHINGAQLHISATRAGSLWDLHLKK